MNDYLPQATLFRLLAVLALVVAPHVPHLPVWVTLGSLAIGGWRAFAAFRQWRLPPRWLRTVMAFSAFGGVYASYGHISGQTAGVALLTAMSALKLTELHSRRDVMFVMFLMYFTLITHFLFSQALWTIIYLLVCALLITALLVEVNHAGRALPPKVSLRLSAVLIAQALPLMVVLFVLFPRLPGPLWGIPADAGAARSGLSDEMAPGDIAHLIESDALAFRVRFFGAAPPMRERYWRGPVFENFDGRRWTPAYIPAGTAAPAIDTAGTPTRYEVTLEANDHPWLFALELPQRSTLPDDAQLSPAGLIVTKDPVRERRLYTLTSFTRHQLQNQLDPRQRERDLRLPRGMNPRTVALGEQWKADGLTPQALVQRALQMFRNQDFVYTLQPPRLGREPVDDFLFNTRKGFCEHYSSAFTVLMRAAGVPARVVTGYQGGERNAIGDYYVVRQSDAHAWSEVWIDGRGWVRIDPTAAVAPERIEAGVGEALHGTAGLPAFLDPSSRTTFRYAIEARWDWVNAQWDRWVLGYGPELQQELFGGLGLDGWRDLMLALTAVMTLLMTLIGVVALRGYRDAGARVDEASRLWIRLQQRMRKLGLPQRVGEGAGDYARRLAQQAPQWAPAIARAASAYQRLRYLDDGADAAELRAAVRSIPRFGKPARAGR